MQIVAVSAILLWLVVVLAHFLWSHFFPPSTITLAPFSVSGSNLKIDGQLLPRILDAKLGHLKGAWRASPSWYGFLNFPTLLLPDGAADDRATMKRFEDLNLKIKDVDVNAVLHLVQAILSPSTLELGGRITELSDSIEITCDLKRGNSTIKSWRSAHKKSSPFDEPADVDRLLEDVLFQVLWDTPDIPELSSRLNSERETNSHGAFANWRGLQAFEQGLQHLQLYIQDMNYSDLEEAQKSFQRLETISPEHPLGMYFYGITLAEDQQEAEAARVFRMLRVKQGLDDHIRYNAWLQEAGARMRLYEDAAGAEVVDSLRDLISELKRRTEAFDVKAKGALEKATAASNREEDKPDAEELASPENGVARAGEIAYYTKLLALSYAQSGYAHGNLVALLEDPGEFGKAEEQFNKAEEILKANMEADSWNVEEKAEVAYQIANGKGYSAFRHLQLKTLDDAGYKKECENAIVLLQAARQKRPARYDVLQNLAMIYDDERYNREIGGLDIAESLYKQTVRLVPKDYFQYERLARIQWLRAKEVPVDGDQRSQLVVQGENWANEALVHRPYAREARLLLAWFQAERFRWARSDPSKSLGFAQRADQLTYSVIYPEQENYRRHLPLFEELDGFYSELLGTTHLPDEQTFKDHQKLLEETIKVLKKRGPG